MNVGALNIRFAEVNGTKENCCVQDLRKQKEPKPEISDFDSFFFCLMFSVTIFRPLTFARNYATIADRKRQIREVIFAGIFRNNRARKRIRTLIFHQGSYAHRLAEGEGFEPPEAFTSTVFKTAAFDRSANLPYEIAVKAIFLKIQPLQICSISASSSAENVRLT